MQQRYVNFRLGHVLGRFVAVCAIRQQPRRLVSTHRVLLFWGEENRSAETCRRDLVRRELGRVYNPCRKWTTCSDEDDVGLHAGSLLRPQHARRTLASAVRGSNRNPYSVLCGRRSFGIAGGRLSARNAANARETAYADTRGMNRSEETSAATQGHPRSDVPQGWF